MAYQAPLNGGRINASVNGTNTAGVPALISTGTMYLAGGNNITLSQNAGSITISGANPAAASINFSAGATSANLAAVTFANSNGVNFGLNGGTLTASHNGLTSQSNQALSGSNGSFTFQTASFGNSNGLNFYTTNGSLVGSYTVPTQSAYSFANSNGVSFGTNGSTVTGTVATNYAASNHSHGNPTLNLTNLSGTTASASNGLTLSLSAAAPSQAAAFSAGTQSANTGTVNFANSNGITFGMSGSNQITASHNGITSQSNQTQNIIQGATAGTGSMTSGNISFANSNGVSFGLSNNTITASVAAGGGGGGVALSGGGTIISSGTASLAAQGALTISGSNQTLSLSVPSASSLSASGIISISANGSTVNIGAAAYSAGISGNTSGQAGTATNQFIIAGGNNITLSQSTAVGGNTISISAAGQTAQTQSNIQAVVAGASTNYTGNISFANSNGVSFGLSNNTITASVAAGGGGGGVALYDGTNSISSGTARLSASGAITASINGQTLNLNVPTVSSLIGTNGITISTTSNSIYVDGGGAGGGGGGFTASYFNPQDAYLQVTGQQGNGTMHIQPMLAPNVSFDRVVFPMVISGTSSITATVSMSMMMGIYTRNSNSFSLSTSYSTSNSLFHNGSANSSANYGLKLFTMGATGSLSEGAYYVGIISRSSTAGGNISISQILASQQNSNLSGFWGQANSASIQYTRGLGTFTATTTSPPAVVAMSQLVGTGSIVLRQPMFYVVNSTF